MAGTGRARIEKIDTEQLRETLARGVVPVVAGFQGQSPKRSGDHSRPRRLRYNGRLPSRLHSRPMSVRYATDVDGVYTADPRVVAGAQRLSQVTFEEMLELASLGSKVLHPRSVEFAGKYQVPLRVLSTFEPGEGTLITMENEALEQAVCFRVLPTLRMKRKLPCQASPDIPGIASRILGPVAAADIEVDVIVQKHGR